MVLIGPTNNRQRLPNRATMHAIGILWRTWSGDDLYTMTIAQAPVQFDARATGAHADRGVIYLPTDFNCNWSDPAALAVLAHEACHVVQYHRDRSLRARLVWLADTMLKSHHDRAHEREATAFQRWVHAVLKSGGKSC